MKTTIWINTLQMVEKLKHDANNEHEYTLHLGGILRSTHWLKYDAERDLYGDSTDWFHYDIWLTESELQEAYPNCWWRRDA